MNGHSWHAECGSAVTVGVAVGLGNKGLEAARNGPQMARDLMSIE